MTRKEELHAMANNFLHQHSRVKKGKPQNCDLECLREMLLRVELEVWEQVIERIETVMEPQEESTDDQVWEFRDWCKQQQEGL